MANTSIEWTDHSINPIRARDKEGHTGHYCEKVSPGCALCYASKFQTRFNMPAFPGKGKPGLDLVEPYLHEPALEEVLNRKKPTKYFWCDMTDLFLHCVPDAWIDRCFAVMAMTPQHTHQILTKRPDRMAAYLNDASTPHRIAKAMDCARVDQARKSTKEERREIAGFPGYFASNFGEIFNGEGAIECDWCGKPLAGQQKRYCSKICRSAYNYKHGAARVIRRTPKLRALSPDSGEKGHLRVTLFRKGERHRELVHRLVLETFGRQAFPGEQGCHLNGDSSDNFIGNLTWGTQSDNWADRKRHGNHRSYSKLSEADVLRIRSCPASTTHEELGADYGVSPTQIANIRAFKQWASECPIEWPLSGVWVGTSTENQQEADARIPHLLDCPAAVRYLSCEPLLGPIDLGAWLLCECGHPRSAHAGSAVTVGCQFGDGTDANPICGCRNVTAREIPEIHWIIAGGESGHGARPMHPDWVRSLRDQCQNAHVAFFFKQWGAWCPPEAWDGWKVGNYKGADIDPDSGKWHIYDNPLRTDSHTDDESTVYRMGKKRAGRNLDGDTWDEFPGRYAL